MKRTESQIDLALAASRQRPFFNVLRVASPVKEAETITFGSSVFEADINGSTTAGRIAIAIAAAASLIAATGTLTFVANPSNNDTVVIEGQTYTFKTSLTASTTANEVLIGADASASLDNLIAAINAGTGGGTLYGSATVANASVTAAAGAGDTMVVTAKVKGTVGNAIATTETLTDAGNVWGSATLASGADTSAADFTTLFTAAVNASASKLFAVRVSANEVLVVDVDRASTVSKACTETLTGSNNAWDAAASYGGQAYPVAIPAFCQISRVPSAQEITLESMHFFFNFAPASVVVNVRTSAGVAKAWDGAVTITATRVTLTSSGSTDLASGDVVTIQASA